MADTFLLMNKNLPLLSFFSEETIYGFPELKEDQRFVDQSLLPPRFSDIQTWVTNRNYAKHKEHLQGWLHEWGIDNAIGFLDITHALSLNDSLWVKRDNSGLDWEQVNLYHNEFTDVVSVTAFETGLHGLKLSTTSPEFTKKAVPVLWVPDWKPIPNTMLPNCLQGFATVLCPMIL